MSDSQNPKNSKTLSAIERGEKNIAGVLRDLYQQFKVGPFAKTGRTPTATYLFRLRRRRTSSAVRPPLREVSVNREKLISLRDQFVLLDAAIRIKRPADNKFKASRRTTSSAP